VLPGVAVQLGMVAVAGAAAVEALEADIEAGGVVLVGLLADAVLASVDCTNDGIEALRAVLAVHRIRERRLGQVCQGRLAVSGPGNQGGWCAYLLLKYACTPCWKPTDV
jgi:hypothetical protein